eukprot:4974215-Prymnesium_polylepis.1
MLARLEAIKAALGLPPSVVGAIPIVGAASHGAGHRRRRDRQAARDGERDRERARPLLGPAAPAADPTPAAAAPAAVAPAAAAPAAEASNTTSKAAKTEPRRYSVADVVRYSSATA